MIQMQRQRQIVARRRLTTQRHQVIGASVAESSGTADKITGDASSAAVSITASTVSAGCGY
ncbi:hypothetical protein ABY58_00615 [Edwardsiella ictaluri]|nr:hypothetical protein ABY58_00615 [Edwardsiella ictaluri]